MTGGKFKLPKGYRETVEAARDEAAKFGLKVSYTLVGKHPKLLGIIYLTPETHSGRYLLVMWITL